MKLVFKFVVLREEIKSTAQTLSGPQEQHKVTSM